MALKISNTNRCALFEKIASTLWARIVRAHSVNMNLRETGITSDIIVDILDYNKTSISNFKVYAQEGWQEKKYGSDIDIFVETNSNQYRWFALQAKLLKKDNTYNTLRDTSDNVMQWLKLRRLEKLSGCKAYYLLYNGKSSYDALQYGCSLVEMEAIKKWVGTKSAGRNKRWIYFDPVFEDFYPIDSEPWRILVCKYHDTINYRLYTFEEIEDANRNYEDLAARPFSEGTRFQFEQKENIDNPIVAASLRAKWSPGVRIIIRRTDNFYKEPIV